MKGLGPPSAVLPTPMFLSIHLFSTQIEAILATWFAIFTCAIDYIEFEFAALDSPKHQNVFRLQTIKNLSKYEVNRNNPSLFTRASGVCLVY